MKNYDLIKKFCNRIYIIGSGNYWYEENAIGNDRNCFYVLYSTLIFSIYGIMTILEIMAAILGDFPEDEKRDSITLAVSHAIVMVKIYCTKVNKSIVKRLNKNMVKVCEAHEKPKIMMEKYKIVRINVIAYFLVVYTSASCFIFEGLRKVFEGKLVYYLVGIKCV
jgi:hypothetical protein